MVLKNQKAFTDKPNAHLTPIDFDSEYEQFVVDFPESKKFEDFLSYSLYPKVYQGFYDHQEKYGDTSKLPSAAFFYGVKFNDEIQVQISKGKNIIIQYLNTNAPRESGTRLSIFRMNGAIRSIVTLDKSLKSTVKENRKVQGDQEIGSPLQGNLSKISVSVGDKVATNDPLFTIEAMKMESTITAPYHAIVDQIILKEKTLVEQDDLVVILRRE